MSNPAAEERALLVALLEAADPDAEARAWAAFLLAYTPLLLGVARSLGGEYDVTMDRYAFIVDHLRANHCTRLRRYTPRAGVSFSGWLRVVARRLCLDLYRHQRGRTRPVAGWRAEQSARTLRAGLQLSHGLPLDVADAIQAADPDPGGALDRLDALARLQCARAGLDAADQELLRLRFEQDLTALQIADRIGAPSQFHVYRRLRRVLGALRAAVEPPHRPGRARRTIPGAAVAS